MNFLVLELWHEWMIVHMKNIRFKIRTCCVHSKQTLSMPAINCQQGMKIVCFLLLFFFGFCNKLMIQNNLHTNVWYSIILPHNYLIKPKLIKDASVQLPFVRWCIDVYIYYFKCKRYIRGVEILKCSTCPRASYLKKVTCPVFCINIC